MVITIIGILIALLRPAVQAAREAARRTQCANNLKQLGLAMHSFHQAERRLPQGMSGCCFGTWMVEVLPYVEQDNLFELYENFGGTWATGIEYKTGSNLADVTRKWLSLATCPSDTPKIFGAPWNMTKHNYAVNYGNTGLENSTTGNNYYFTPELNGVEFKGAPFGSRETFQFAHIRDGLSNTLLMSEQVQTHGLDTRGLTWWGDAAGFTTYLAPNSSQPDLIYSITRCDYPYADNPPCEQISSGMPSMYAARSRHPGGVQAALCDGSVRFISDSIDINTWRALSTTRGSEPISGNY